MTEQKGIIKLDKNQPVYVGIDVHKNKWDVCIMHQGEIVKRAAIPGTFIALSKMLDHYKGHKIETVYEAGFSGFHLHDKLTDKGIKNIVVSPNKIPVKVGDLVKNDRRDAKKLAFSLSKGLLEGIFIPSREQRDVRQIIRLREQVKRKRNRAIQQLKMYLLLDDIPLKKGLTIATKSMLTSLALSEYQALTVKTHIEEVESFEKKIKELDRIAHSVCQQEKYYQTYHILRSVPGIGPVIAAALCFEIGDFSRFSRGKKLSAFLGLTQREFSTGEKIHRGRITGQGNPWLRSYLIEASWKMMSKDLVIRNYYNRIKSNTGSGKKAIVAVARKMVCRMHSMVINKQCYGVGVIN